MFDRSVRPEPDLGSWRRSRALEDMINLGRIDAWPLIVDLQLHRLVVGRESVTMMAELGARS